MTTRTKVSNWLRNQLTYVEGPNNDNKFAAIAGHTNHQPWCCTVLVAAFRACGGKLGNESAYVPSLMSSLGEELSDPQPGAIGFLHFPKMGRYAHAVYVESVRPDGRFVTLEGNTDVAGGRTGGRFMRKVRSTVGFKFFMPHYDPEPKKPSKPPAKKTAPKKSYGNCVKLQKAVRVTPDNQWGADTDKACEAIRGAGNKQFPSGAKFAQHCVGTTEDGAWGGESRRALQRTILEVQEALIEMSHVKFPRTGVWDAPTEAAYQKVRKICRRP